MRYEDVLKLCGGVKTESAEHRDYRGQKYIVTTFTKVGPIEIPTEELYIEIKATATSGTVGRLVGIDVETSTVKSGEVISKYRGSYLYEAFDASTGKIKKGRVQQAYAYVLKGPRQTNYVRNVSKHEPVKKKVPVNKFKQELKKGDWVFGVSPSKTLKIGRVTRWTNHNVWAVYGNDITDKSKEFRLDSISETFLVPDEGFLSELTMAALKGWNGQ